MATSTVWLRFIKGLDVRSGRKRFVHRFKIEKLESWSYDNIQSFPETPFQKMISSLQVLNFTSWRISVGNVETRKTRHGKVWSIQLPSLCWLPFPKEDMTRTPSTRYSHDSLSCSPCPKSQSLTGWLFANRRDEYDEWTYRSSILDIFNQKMVLVLIVMLMLIYW